ncbi:hypothetical protein [Billgrantia ethanolica]|uniref:TFIIS-type domain-containing protein n=1 Tax=Billgrantia ethanolica TaxID=2733486 RepID=A0ABS9A5C0_9GAMM|nr:hypothetical protein [Halomonas ethanolica]MCE8004023.1 hypothetical protein [Halomonas ethanolica]
MADIASRLDSVRKSIERLAELAAPAQAEEARRLADTLEAQLDNLVREVAAHPADQALNDLPRSPRHEEIRCPVCSLRSFTYQKGTLRRSADSRSGLEALYHCLSCGHEAWHEAQ